MAKKSIHHMETEDLVEINKEVVALTREPHQYPEADAVKLKELMSEVEARAENQEPEDAITEKASLLIYRVASGQHFKAGNRRTALVAGLVFLMKNGYKVKIDDPTILSVVDKAGIAAITLDDLREVVAMKLQKTPVERKGWERTTKETVERQRKLLTRIGA